MVSRMSKPRALSATAALLCSSLGLAAEAQMIDLSARRRFFAEEVQMVANIRSSSVVEALASVPR